MATREQVMKTSEQTQTENEEQIEKEELTESQKNEYRDILKKQYKDLSYKIVKEEIEEDVTYVTVKVSVYDLYKAQSDSSTYLADNMDEFYDENGKYDSERYIDYKYLTLIYRNNQIKLHFVEKLQFLN